MHCHKIAVFTSNKGKFRNIARLRSLDPLLQIVWIRGQAMPEELEDTKSGSENAKKKAIAGSLLTDYMVLSTDEELFLKYLGKRRQPGALIRRVVGKKATDHEMMVFYEKLLRQIPPEQRQGIIKTYYALAIHGHYCGTTMTVRRCIFALPPSKFWMSGHPLSAFHFLPEIGKRYSELSESESWQIERPIAQKILKFIKLTMRRYRERP
jgi:inosine/xanthosine triphosphate pyrophosphatase family protein